MTVLSYGPLYLSIDQGGHASRAIVFDAHGAQLAHAEVEIHSVSSDQDRVEMAAEELLESLQRVLDDIAEQLGDDCQRLRGVGLATQRSSLVCWDRHSGIPLSPVISWQDRRAANWMAQHLQEQGVEESWIHDKTGLYPSPHYGASKMHWCLHNIPSVVRAHEQGRLVMGPMASFLIYHLTREHALLVDPVNASRTLLMDIHEHDWDDALLSLFQLPRSVLPACVPSCYHYGQVRIGSAEVPLKVVTGDLSAALFAFGPPVFDAVYITLGTGAFVQRPSGFDHINSVPPLLSSVVLDDDQHRYYALEGTVNGAGSALSWYGQESGLDIEAHLDQWMREVSEPPLFLNGISGLGSPYWQPHFDSCFIGQASPEARAVAVAESIVFLLQVNLDTLMQQASRPGHIVISGGLSALTPLCQALSDLSGLAIYRPQEHEATARGLGYLVAQAEGRWIETEHGQWFEPRSNSALQARYRRWTMAMEEHLESPQQHAGSRQHHHA